MKPKFSFSGKFTRKEHKFLAKQAERFFHTDKDLEQLPGEEITYEFLTKKFPNSANIIRQGKKIVGHTFVLPCSKKLMRQFLNGKITERQLFYCIREEITYQNFETIYLCSALLLPEHRGQGLAAQSMADQVKKISSMRKGKTEIFAWPQTLEGKKMAQNVAKITRKKVLMKK